MGLSKACFIFLALQLLQAVAAQELAKRVPQGFIGTRGKKYDQGDIHQQEVDHFFKRKPQFFIGVKGKKNIYDLLNDPEPYYKRAPMGFVGMRGKKETIGAEYLPDSYEYLPKKQGSLIGEIDYAANDGIENPQFPFLNELLNEYLAKLERSEGLGNTGDSNAPSISSEESMENDSNDIEKRAANMHQFYGVRGKKSLQNKRPYDLTFRGRFIGVRGKKDLKNNQAQEIRLLMDQNGPWPKRKSQMGFFGMRGKKWGDEAALVPVNEIQ